MSASTKLSHTHDCFIDMAAYLTCATVVLSRRHTGFNMAAFVLNFTILF